MSDRRTVIAAGTSLTGGLRSDDDVHVAGLIEGHVHSAAKVVVLPTGVVRGAIDAAEIVIDGRVVGDVTAVGKVEIGARGHLLGDIQAARFSIQDGGSFRGQVQMTSVAAPVTDAEVAGAASLELDASDTAETPPESPAVPPPGAATSDEGKAMWVSGEFLAIAAAFAEDPDARPASNEELEALTPPDEVVGVEVGGEEDDEPIPLDNVTRRPVPAVEPLVLDRRINYEVPPAAAEPELLTQKASTTIREQIEAARARRQSRGAR